MLPIYRLIALAFFSITATVVSAEENFLPLDSSGKFLEIEILPDSANSVLSAFVSTKGNESEYINFTIFGPAGTKVTARSQALGKASIKSVLAASKGWINAPFQRGASSLSNIQIPNATGTSGSSPANGRFYCLDFTAEDLDTVIEILRMNGDNFTRDELCALYGDNSIRNDLLTNGNGSSANLPTTYIGSTSALALIRKDTCALKKEAQSVVRFDISLSGVSESDRRNGFKLKLSTLPIKYVGSKAASLKPIAEKKYFPKALFLVHSAGFGGGLSSPERMNLVKFSKGKVSLSKIKIEDYVLYRGNNLARAVAERYLSGGNGVVEMQTDYSTYSVCFKLIKRRQKMNGYQN